MEINELNIWKKTAPKSREGQTVYNKEQENTSGLTLLDSRGSTLPAKTLKPFLPHPLPVEEEGRPGEITVTKRVFIGIMAALGLLGGVIGTGASENRAEAQQFMNPPSQSITISPPSLALDSWVKKATLRNPVLLTSTPPETASSSPINKSELREISREDPFPGKVAITFDDGPDPKETLEILSTLKKNKIRATFFVSGEKAEKYPLMVKKIVGEGHTLGFHGYTGRNLQTMAPADISEDIEKGQKAVEKALTRPYPVHHFRPLEEDGFTEPVKEQAARARKGLISWHIETGSGPAATPSELAKSVIEQVRKERGGVVRLRNFSRVDTKALPEILKHLKSEGYEFYTVDDLLAQKYGETDLAPAKVNDLLEETAERYGVPKDILKAVAWRESGWKHFDDQGRILLNINKNKEGKVLSIDWGMMQINDRHNPSAFPEAKESIKSNVEYAAGLLKDLYKETKSWRLALWSYNGAEEYADRTLNSAKAQPWRYLLMAKR